MKLLTIGTFDTPHMAHAVFLAKCREFADKVVVGVNTDDFVATFKQPPIYTYEERSHLVRALGYTVLPNDSAGRELITLVKPDVLAIGSDWARKDYYKQIDVDQDFLDDWGISMVYVPYTKGESSTTLKQRIRG